MGFGTGHTEVCFSASKVKQSYQQWEDERCSLMGNAFAVASFVLIASALCVEFQPYPGALHLCSRLGLAPGASCNVSCTAPMQLGRAYGGNASLSLYRPRDLNLFLMRHCNHTGSDIRIASGTALNPKGLQRASLSAGWWLWNIVFAVRLTHLSDSFVCVSVLAKGRTSSKALDHIVTRTAAHLLASGSTLIQGHVDSLENPTDAASRA